MNYREAPYVYQGDFLGALVKLGATTLKTVATKLVPKHTIVGKMLSGGVKTALPAAVGYAAGAAARSTTPAAAPPLPGALVTTPGTAVAPGGFLSQIGPRGPGGKIQWPWQDPNVHQSLKQFALDDSFLKTYYRAPKGFVVVRDNNLRPYPLQKWVAKKIGWWREPNKPPITGGEWNKYKTARAVEKKLFKIARAGLRRRGLSIGSRPSMVIQESGPGGVNVRTFRKKAA